MRLISAGFVPEEDNNSIQNFEGRRPATTTPPEIPDRWNSAQNRETIFARYDILSQYGLNHQYVDKVESDRTDRAQAQLHCLQIHLPETCSSGVKPQR